MQYNTFPSGVRGSKPYTLTYEELKQMYLSGIGKPRGTYRYTGFMKENLVALSVKQALRTLNESSYN